MTVLAFSGIVFLVAAVAGFVGSLTGLGGGVVITPVLTLMLGVDIHLAMGATLISVIATSSGAAAAYVREGFTNVRVGMFLEIATTMGAIAGAHLTAIVPTPALAVVFGAILLYSAWQSFHIPADLPVIKPDPLALRLRLGGDYPSEGALVSYQVQRVKSGFAMMFGAGLLGGLLGLGSGAMKVIAMDKLMRIPFKVSTTTSNFMIGVTAAASAGVFFGNGYIHPDLAMPVMLGVLGGSVSGARLLKGARTKTLRLVFAVVIAVLAIEMVYSGLFGGLK